MSQKLEKSAEWLYRGIWRVLSDWFRVPQPPPSLPTSEGDFIVSFHPSRRYLSYLKLYFWVALAVVDFLIGVAWLIIFIWNSQTGILLLLPALLLAITPDIFAYIAVHLRYDTMWYVMSDRSLRCRRGVWVILEHTITFENVQNVFVRRGPIQYFFGFSTIILETAGAAAGEHGESFAVGNRLIMQGIDNPKEVSELIMERVRVSRTAGLGDEQTPDRTASVLNIRHISALKEILTEVRALN